MSGGKTMSYERVEESSLAESHYHLAQVFIKQKHWQKAIEACSQTIELAPDYVPAYQSLGELLMHQEDWDRAINCYYKAIELKSEVAGFHHSLGFALSKQQRWNEAVEALDKATKLNPDFSWSHNSLGEALLRSGRWKEAVVALRKAIELNPNFAWSHHNLGEALVKLGEFDQAATAYYHAQELQNGTSEVSKSSLQPSDENASSPQEIIEDLSNSNTQDQNNLVSVARKDNNLNQKDNSPINLRQSEFSITAPSQVKLKIQRLNQEIELLVQTQDKPDQNKINNSEIDELNNLKSQLVKLNQQLDLLSDHEISQNFNLLNLPAGKPIANNLVIKADFPLPITQGFQLVEYAQDGQQFRWTGPGNCFYFDLFIDRTVELELSLKLLKFGGIENFPKLACLVNHEQINLTYKNGSDAIYLTGILARQDRLSCTKISFIVPQINKISEEQQDSQDHRLVGVPFASFSISPLAKITKQ